MSCSLRTAAGWSIAFAILVAAAPASAQLRSSPGSLSTSHAGLDNEDSCNECHNDGRGLTNSKCLGCHEHSNMRRRIASGKGFHASSRVAGRRCWQCHLEHKGRGFNIMGWSAVGLPSSGKGFDHDVTGWPLNGKHKATECKDCHKRRNRQGLRTHLGEDRLCGSCHKSDQPHGFTRRAMLKCERCHTESYWRPPKSSLRFDHNDRNDAKMPLEGSHTKVSCAKCHPRARFNLGKSSPASCRNCHKSNHRGHLFDKKNCSWCHSPKRSFRRFSFNHKARTKFDLGRSHGRLNCYRCHTKRLKFKKPSRSCGRCHASDNRHGNRFKAFGRPPACETCHSPAGRWKSAKIFNHNRRTKFKLTGKHAEISCRRCHRGKNPADFERFNPKKVGCMGCHAHTNVHDGEFSDKQCLNCHKGAGRIRITRKAARKYHGPRSRFPLDKGHKGVTCEKCHINDNYKDTPMECGVRCHEDSLHRGTLGDECSTCHSPGTWKGDRFDHTDDTEWPLRGFHRTVPKCADCHPKRDYAKTPTNCSAQGCHAKDDAHLGRLGDKCERCHSETGENFFNHNVMSRYKLDGAHLTTKCSECHPKMTFKPRPTNCFGCHPEPDVHKGQYGTRCEDCHNTTTFASIVMLHDVGDFSLKGSHDQLPCQRCHKDNRPLAGSGNFCINCHRQDDVHGNSLSPRCGTCHSQWSFAPARFDHSTVGCNLTGLHRVLPCYDCHKSGNFGGVTPQCAGCHVDLARKTGIQMGTDHATVVNCSDCHNPNAWKPAQGAFAYNRESICR